MRKISNFIIVASAMLVLFTACNDDKYDDSRYVVYAMGDITSRTNTTTTVLENELDTLLLTNTSGINYGVGKRVNIVGEPISENRRGQYKFWEIRVLNIDTVLTKAPILRSVLEADPKLNEEVGNDDIYLYRNPSNGNLSAGTSMDKYLDIIFTIPTGNMGKAHFINLEVDDSEGDFDGTKPLKVKLRHNAFGDTGNYIAHGYVSFKIDKYMDIVRNMAGDNNKLEIIISYGGNRTYTITWKPEGNNKPTNYELSKFNMLKGAVITK